MPAGTQTRGRTAPPASSGRGSRQLSDDRTSVVVDNSAQGQCNGFWKGSRKNANDKCSEWRKWTDIRDWSGVTRATYP